MQSGNHDILIIELKDTITQLNNTISAQATMITSLQKSVDALTQSLANKDAELEYMKKKLFGKHSEKRDFNCPGQLSLFPEEEEPEPVLVEGEVIEVRSHVRERKSKASYEEQFASLPKEQIIVDTLSAEEKRCTECNTEMIPIGHEVIRSEVIYIPSSMKVIEFIATTYECPKCKETEKTQFIKDNGPQALIPGSYASESLVTEVMYQKFVNALPFYRQEQDFLRQFNVRISRSTMAHWCIICFEMYFHPVCEALHKELLKRRYLMADETVIQVLKEPERRPESKSYAWLFRTGEDGLPPIILYHYTPTRGGFHAAEFLKGAAPGYYLMVDGYQGYNQLKEYHRCVCWAHIRRYLLEAIPKGHEKDYANPAVQGVLYCNKLFEYERSYKEKGISYDYRQKRRLKDEKPVIEGFLSWIDKQKAERGSRFERALTYIQNRRNDLMTYLEDGHCSLCNNASEQSIRPVTIGRKNYLFSDTQAGADASMAIYSLIETAKAQGLNPKKYLSYLLKYRPSAEMSQEELLRFAPWNETVRKACCNDIASDVE